MPLVPALLIGREQRFDVVPDSAAYPQHGLYVIPARRDALASIQCPCHLERSVRGACVGKKNYLFFGSTTTGQLHERGERGWNTLWTRQKGLLGVTGQLTCYSQGKFPKP